MLPGGDGPGRIGDGSAQVGPPPVDPDGEGVASNPPIENGEPAAVSEIAAAPARLARILGRPGSTPFARIQAGADFFGSDVTIFVSRMGPEEIPIVPHGFETLEAASGAMIHYAYEDDATIKIVGYLNDVVPLLYSIMDSTDGTERFTNYYSPATIVRDLEWTHGDSESGEFTNASRTTSVKWNRDSQTGFYEFEIHFSNPPSRISMRWLFDRFTALTEHEITEVVKPPLTLDNVRNKLESLLREAHAEDILRMLGAANHDINVNNGVAPDSGLFVGNIDVGIGVGKEGFITSVILDFNQGDRIDETGIIRSWNRCREVGFPLPDEKGFVWKIDDTFPAHAKNADWNSPTSEPLRRFVFGLFKQGLTHKNSASRRPPIGGDADVPPPHGTAASTGRRSAAHYVGRERPVRRGATARFGARHFLGHRTVSRIPL